MVSADSATFIEKNNKPHVLIADDEPEVLENIARRLSRKNFEVDTAETEKEAKELIEKDEYDAVVTDMFMENATSGLEVVKSAKRKNENTKCFVITARGSYENVLKSQDEGALKYIDKNDDDPYGKLDQVLEKEVQVHQANQNLPQDYDLLLLHIPKDMERVEEIKNALGKFDITMLAFDGSIPLRRDRKEENEYLLSKPNAVGLVVGKNGPSWEDIRVKNIIKSAIEKDKTIFILELPECKRSYELPGILYGLNPHIVRFSKEKDENATRFLCKLIQGEFKR